MADMIRLLTISILLLALSACDGHREELLLVNPDGPVAREIVSNLVDLLDEDAAIRIRLGEEPLTGGQALEAIADGSADIALISNDQPFREDIATVMPLYATVLHIVHPADRAPSDIVELLGNADVYAGQDGSASRRVLERLTSQLDLGEYGYRFITDRNLNVDVAVIFAPIAPERLAEFPGVKLWSIGDPDQIGAGSPLDAAVLLNPHFRPFVVPTGTYGGATPSPVATIAVDKLIVTRKGLDEAVVYDLINEILRLRPALAALHPGVLQDLSDDFDASRSRFILHPGTLSYLQRSEPTFVERYSGVAEVLVTVLVAAFSAAFAGYRVFNRRRKNRIDRFYAAALEVRDSISSSANDTDREAALNRLRDLQDEAFGMLVAEKLAADESFRIFITLCEDVSQRIAER